MSSNWTDATQPAPAEKQLLDATGQPARRSADRACPQCAAGPDRRGPSAGFGVAHPICLRCGYEWTDEVWR